MQFKIFYNLLAAPQTVSNTYTQTARAQPCANHVQQNEHLSCANVMCHLVRRDSSAIKFDRVEIAFTIGLLYWLKPLTDEYCLIACVNRPSLYNFMILPIVKMIMIMSKLFKQNKTKKGKQMKNKETNFTNLRNTGRFPLYT